MVLLVVGASWLFKNGGEEGAESREIRGCRKGGRADERELLTLLLLVHHHQATHHQEQNTRRLLYSSTAHGIIIFSLSLWH